ncbi:MAG: cytochrome c [Bryobacteraceae bacterium]
MKTLAILLFAACGLAFAGAPEGKTVYEAKCQKCHGPNGEGKASIAKMYNITLKPLASKEVQAISDADMKKDIITGKGKMKPIVGLEGKDLDNVIAYVRTLK